MNKRDSDQLKADLALASKMKLSGFTVDAADRTDAKPAKTSRLVASDASKLTDLELARAAGLKGFT